MPRKNNAKSLGKKQRKEVTKIIERVERRGTELKYDDYITASSVPNQWSFTQFVSPTKGTDDFRSRIGDRINPTKIEFKFSVARGSADAVCRIVIIRVKTGTSSGLYFNQGSTAPTGYAPYSAYAKDRRKDIDVLYDKMVSVDQYNPLKIGSKNIHMAKTKPICFDGATSTTYTVGGLYICLVSDQASGATAPGMTYSLRTFYTDS